MRNLIFVFLLLIPISCSIDNFGQDSSEKEAVSLRTKAFSLSSATGSTHEFQFYIDSTADKIIYDTLSNGVILQKSGGNWIFEGDIYVDDRNIQLIEELGTRSAFRTQANYYWPMRVVYYKYHSSFGSTYQYYAEAVMNDLSSICGISFEPASQNTTNYILFKYSSSGNSSPVGMLGGEQIINIHDCYPDVMAHEIMHSLGFFHEHSRTDRNSYIEVMYDNIRPDYTYAFNQYVNNGYQGTDFGPFDYSSIMLYSSYITDLNIVYSALTPTLLKRDGSTIQSNYTLSTGDVDGLKSIYGPPYHRMETQTINVITDYSDNTTEIYEEEREACIKFYSSTSCLSRMQTSFPRRIMIRKYIQTCSSYNQLSSYYIDQQITVPSGVDSVYVDSYINYEEYLYSNPLSVNVINYDIVNSHVPTINQY